MRWLPIVLLLSCEQALPQGKWIHLRPGAAIPEGADLYTNAGEKEGRETLTYLEQFRHALGKSLGKADLKTPMPLRVLLFKPPKEPDSILDGRERITIILGAGRASSPAFRRAFARLLIESNTDRMPKTIESGLLTLFSTLDAVRTRITLGRPVPESERDLDWARVHLLSVDAEYYGKLSVLINNLQRGIEPDVAYRNAFARTAAEIEQQTARYLAAGQFGTTSVSARPIDPERDMTAREIEADTIQQMLTGLDRDREASEEYDRLLEAAKGEPDAGKALDTLRRAVELRPRRAEPHVLIAQRESDPRKKIAALKTATSLNRRDAAPWPALAEAYQTVHEYPDAAKAWRAAEQASPTDQQAAQMRRSRLDIEKLRLDHEDAEKKRAADEKEREIRKLKDAAIAELRALEARVNQGQEKKPDSPVVPWWDGPGPPGKAKGMLKQVDCLGRQARLVIDTDDRKTIKLLVRDPGKIVITTSSGEQTLGCGVQKPRRVTVSYYPKPEARLATAGDVAMIEFQ